MRFDMRAVESHSFRRFSRFGRRLEDALHAPYLGVQSSMTFGMSA
jgi:hypothetical protein